MPLTNGDLAELLSREAATQTTSAAGATFFGWRPLKIDHEIRDYYFDFLAREFPMLTNQYVALYSSGAHTPRQYQEQLDRRVAEVRSRYSFVDRPHVRRSAPAEGRQLTLAI